MAGRDGVVASGSSRPGGAGITLAADAERSDSTDPARRGAVMSAPMTRLLETDYDSAFVVELERFQGPLDLLLHLIRSQDIDIFDIPIAQITGQFLQAIATLKALELDRAGEFLEMAATLVRIKAQMLLPRQRGGAGEGDDPRAELVRRLLEYEHFRDLARRFEDSEADRSRHYGRGYVPPRDEPPIADELPPLEIEWEDVFAAALSLADRVRSPLEHRVVRRPVTTDEKVGLILQALAAKSRVAFGELVEPFADRLHAAVTLLAGLELSKREEVSLRQSEPFATLWLYRRTRKGR